MKYLKYIITKIIIYSSKNLYLSFDKVNNSEIIFVLGMFRSGTSLTCSILNKIGFNVGPNWRLLKAKGELKELNPNGFYEEFIFIQLPFYWCSMIRKGGDNPPNEEDILKFNLNPICISDFIKFSEFEKKETRINYINRHYLYLLLILKREKIFNFKKNQIIKSPMLTPFYPQLKSWFPLAKFLIVIRNPKSTIQSSMQLTDKADIVLYNLYYIHLVNLFNTTREKCAIFSYDKLLSSPKASIISLAEFYNLPYNEKAVSLINDDLIRNSEANTISNKYYDTLFENSIN